MDELEFAQAVAKQMQPKTLEIVLRAMQKEGFRVPGFKNIEKVPVNVLIYTIRKPVLFSEPYDTLFLRCVRDCGADDPVVPIVNLWDGPEDDKKKAEEQLYLMQKANEALASTDPETDETSDTAIEAEDAADDIEGESELDKVRSKNKALQQKVMDLRIQLDNEKKNAEAAKKDLRNANRERELLEKNLTLAGARERLHQEQALGLDAEKKQMAAELKFYEDLFAGLPKVLCITKEPVSKEDGIRFHLTVISDIEEAENMNLNDFSKIWITENDFGIGDIQAIRRKTRAKVYSARNIETLIERG